MTFDDIPEEGQEEPKEIVPVFDERKAAERMEKLLNMLASDNGYEPMVAATKIASLARSMGLTVSEAVRKLLAAPAPAPAPRNQQSNPYEAAAYTASGVPRDKVKPKPGDHDLRRLKEAFDKIKDTEAVRVLDVQELKDIGFLLELSFDWQMSRWERKQCRQLTKKMLQGDADPLI